MAETLNNWPTSLASGEQPGTRHRVQKSGLVEIISTFILTNAAYESILPTLPRAPHPRWDWAYQDGTIEAVQETTNRWRLENVVFRGSQSDLNFNADDDDVQVGSPTVFELGSATAEELLFSNPEYNSLSETDRIEVKTAFETWDGLAYPASYPTWPAKKQQLFSKFATYGTMDATWRAPRDTWTVRYNSTSNINSSIMRRRGTITRPWGPAPALDDDRDWLLDSAVSVQTGASWDIILTWLASGPGGWDADHYGRNRGSSS